MPYTPNTPQGNNTIASTTDLIRDNFGFIETDLQAEHSFNNNSPGVAEGSHLQASMPHITAPSGALPAGTTGIYYMRSGTPRFYDGTTNWRIQITGQPQSVITGTVALTTSYANVFTIPSFSYGYYFISPTSGSGIAATTASAAGFVLSTGSHMKIEAVGDIGITLTDSTLTLQAKVDNSSNNGTYNYSLIYFTP